MEPERMGLWGKVIGGTTGFMVGGPFGAAVGFLMGNAIERRTQQAVQNLLQAGPVTLLLQKVRQEGRETVLALASLSLAARLARVDGPITQAEEDALLRSLGVPEGAGDPIIRLFRSPAHEQLGPAAVAARLGELFASEPERLEALARVLGAVAVADGPVGEAEMQFLRAVCAAMGLSSDAWKGLGGGSSGRLVDPYAILGVSPDVSDEDARAAFRRLLRETHPDALRSQSATDQQIAEADVRMAVVNAAWDEIRRRRGLR
jgi:DnaJ like chaperone protein